MKRSTYSVEITDQDLAERRSSDEANAFVRGEIELLKLRAVAGGQHAAARMIGEELMHCRVRRFRVWFDSRAWTG